MRRPLSKISEEAWYLVHMASEADSQEKGDYLQISYFGLCQWQEGFECDVHTEVMGLHQLSRSVSRGDSILYGFLRFPGTSSELHSVCQTGF